MSKKVRAKFSCSELTENGLAKLNAVYGTEEENKDFTEATPYGTLEIQIDENVPAEGFFEVGKDYYLDFTPVE